MDNSDGKFLKRLSNALKSAYSLETLPRLTLYELDLNLEEIAGKDEDVDTKVFKLIKWAREQSRLEELIERASEYQPKNQDLGKIANETIKPKIEQGINELLADPKISAFIPLLNILKRMLDAGMYSPGFYFALLNSVPKMQAEIVGENFDEVIEKISNEDPVRANWMNEFTSVVNSVEPEIKNKLSKGVVEAETIPVILVVMTKEEVLQVNNGQIFEGFPQEIQENFAQLKEILEHNGVPDWVDRYGETAGDWQPFSNKEGTETIETIVSREISKISIDGNNITPDFIDIKSITGGEKRRILMKHREQDCIVIVDLISLCHPFIHSQFHETMLDVYENTFVFSIAPVSQAFEKIENMSLIIQMKLANLEFYKRKYDKKYDSKKEAGTCQELHDKALFEVNLMERTQKIFKVEQKKHEKPVNTEMF